MTSSNVETELRTTVLPSIDITITTLSPLSVSSREREPDLLAREPPTTTTITDDGVTPSQRATVRAEVTTATTTAATEIPNQNHDNPMMDQTGTLPHSPAENSPDSTDKIEEDGHQQNIPVLNVDVNDLIPSLQDEGLAQIKNIFSKKYFNQIFSVIFAAKLFI